MVPVSKSKQRKAHPVSIFNADELCDICGNKIRRCQDRCEDIILAQKEGE